MNKTQLRILFILLSLFITSKDIAASQWAKTYGGGNHDRAYCIQQTTDDGFIVTGMTWSFGAGNYDLWIVRLDPNGNPLWQKTYGGADADCPLSIQQTTDGGFIVAGTSGSFGAGWYDFWVFKLDPNGNPLWQKTYGGGNYDEAYSIQQTTDGGYIVAGYTWSFGAGWYDFWVLKLDSDGNPLWQKTYGGGNWDVANSIEQTTDGGYIVAGRTASFGAGRGDFWVLKLDSGGNPLWQKTYGGVTFDCAESIQQTTDGGYIVAGRTGSLTGYFGASDSDAWVLKLDADGNPLWQKTYGGGTFDEARSIQQTTDGGFIVAGVTNSFGIGDYDFWVLKLDSSGNPLWQKTYGGVTFDYVLSIQQTTDGGFIVAGETNSSGAGVYDFLVLKLNNNGEIKDCDIIGTSNATVTDTTVSPANTSVNGVTSSATITNTSIIAQETSATINVLCFDIGGKSLIPDTGQTKCYNDTQEITCPQPGEPFYGQDAQYVTNPQSYTKLDENGNDLPDDAPWPWAMARDNVTGLIWEIKQDKDGVQNYSNPHDADNTYTWYDSNPATNGGDPGAPGDGTDTEDFINALNTEQFGGYNDWRLPAITELPFIRNMDISYPAINTTYFPNTIASYHWSSTTDPCHTFNAWYVPFNVGAAHPGEKSVFSFNVRAVRGGQFTNNFIDNEDGTVTDTSTGLMWQQATAPGGYTWQQALFYCENLILNNDGEWTSGTANASGARYDDWRLPNINELHSIIDFTRCYPSIDTEYFPNTQSSYYWTSTTWADYPYLAWNPSFNVGAYPGDHHKASYYDYVRAVRGITTIDADHDGYSPPEDCNDNDASINPGATEVCDDEIDNDCDGLTDMDDLDCLDCVDFDWTYKANMITPRFAGATVVLDNNIYTLCGHEGRLQGVSNEVYDTSTNTWTSLTSLPRSDGRYGLGAAASDGKIYTFCGTNIWGNYGTNTVDMYDPATNLWTLNIATYPLTLKDVEAVAANGKIYCIGGGYPTYNNVYEFDPQSRTFTPKASMPSPKGLLIPIAYNNKIYVFGGWNSGVESNEIFIYNISSDSWSIAGSTLRNLDAVGGVIGNKIYILDGTNPEETKKIIEYDPMTDTITQKTPYNEIFREGPFGGVVNGKFYVMGGANYISGTFIPSTEEGTIIPCEEPDSDNDGYSPPEDCNDNDASINPSALEVCDDGVDNNCNGYADQFDEFCYIDLDLDDDGYIPPEDCNDNDASINPSALEVCDDGKDNNCNDYVDCRDPGCDSTCYTKGIVSLCERFGESTPAFFPDQNWSRVEIEVTVGDTVVDRCMGRCGEGCPGDGEPECGGVHRYTQACLNHDACVKQLGDFAEQCWTILDNAVDDCLSAPICFEDADRDLIPDDFYDITCSGGENENCNDNCPEKANPDQADADGDDIGDVCESLYLALKAIDAAIVTETAVEGTIMDADAEDLQSLIELSIDYIDEALDEIGEAWQNGELEEFSTREILQSWFSLQNAKILDNWAIMLLNRDNYVRRLLARRVIQSAINLKGNAKGILE